MRVRAALLSVVLTAASVVVTTEAGASHDETPCAEVTLVFARGSGQDLNGREAPAFFRKVGDRLDGVAVNTYELGTEDHGGGQYPAVGIGFDSLQSFKNLIESDASWTGGAGGNYRGSVAEGVTELTSYLQQRSARCPDELFAVGGYSQGAQVVGEALRDMGSGLRSNIAHVALFGDPKLYLPEGRGPFPPACVGRQFSKWRRGNVSCFTDNGILESRNPYLPDDVQDRAGSWCDRNDPICNNNPTDFVHSAHAKYADDGGEMDEAAAEAAREIAERLPEHADTIDITIIQFAAGNDGLDVVFVIDSTGSMAGRIGSAVSIADEVATSIAEVRGRVALTEYKDFLDPIVAAIRAPLSSDLTGFRSALSALRASGGGDLPEALLAALMTSFNGLDWKPGATKAAIVLTDAEYHDPDRAQGWTTADVIARSLEIDPVNVYTVVPSFLTSTYAALTEGTAGDVVLDTGNTAQALRTALEAVTTRPVVTFAFDEYFAAPGDAILFEVDAFDVDGDIVEFQWDLDGDGAVDETTSEPTLEWTYAAPFSGLAEVRALSSDGGIGSAVTAVDVSLDGLADELPGTPADLSATSTPDSAGTRSVELSWNVPPTGGPVDGWTVRTGDGVVLGRLPATTTTLTVHDVPTGVVEVEVLATNRFGSSDPPASLVIPSGELSPLDELRRLRADIDNAGLPNGTENSLLSKLDAAIASVERGNLNSACGQLGAFRNHLASSSVRQNVPAELLADWDARAARIEERLDC